MVFRIGNTFLNIDPESVVSIVMKQDIDSLNRQTFWIIVYGESADVGACLGNERTTAQELYDTITGAIFPAEKVEVLAKYV